MAGFRGVLVRMVLGLALLAPGGALFSSESAGGLPAPASENVVLTLRGAISVTNGQDDSGPLAAFDMAMLQALPATEFATSTVWTDGVSTYSGVLLRDLLEHVGGDGRMLHATAIDGYRISMALSDLHEDGPIIAYLRDGAAMPVRDKGPLWVIYPFDSNPDYRNETNYARSIWQLEQIEIER